jgi:multiple sugar transport system substrate-binding protein
VRAAGSATARRLVAAGLALVACGAACRSARDAVPHARRLAVLVPASEKPYWQPIAESFQSSSPGVGIQLVEGPNATDLRENLYTAALLARDPSLDLVYMDVTWTSKLAAAGWLRALDEAFPARALDGFLPSAVAAGRYRGRLHRIPVRTDVGLLYYRRDLVERAGLDPPETFADLARVARALQSPPSVWGYVWQAGQYEGLVCNYLEVLHGHAGFWVDPETLEVGLDRPQALAALDFLRATLAEDPITPPGVTTYKEEESRRLFQDGRAVFLRNWSYAWRLVQSPDSPVAGKVGVIAMVHAPGASGAGTLGGWGLGVSRYSREPDLAVDFIRHATSLASQRAFCGPTGYAPARRDAYDDAELLAANPFLERMRDLQKGAVARPAIPRYALASDILQRHLSAALSGLEGAPQALEGAARETRLLLQDLAASAPPAPPLVARRAAGAP